MITVQVDDRAVILKLKAMPDAIRSGMDRTLAVLAEKLRTHIVSDKLRGQVLNRVTGRLGRSIQWKLERGQQYSNAIVYSAGDVPYAAIHEFGGRTNPHVIEAKNVKALSFMQNGRRVFYKRVNHPGSVMKERSYMRSSLADMREEIIAKLTQSIEQSAQL